MRASGVEDLRMFDTSMSNMGVRVPSLDPALVLWGSLGNGRYWASEVLFQGGQ